MSPTIASQSRNLTQRERTLIETCLMKQNPTEEELRAFFHPGMMERRMKEWFEKFRRGELEAPPRPWWLDNDFATD